MRYPQHLLKLIDVFKRLPGVGSKSAERFAFQLLTWPKEKVIEMAKVLEEVPLKLHACAQCGCLAGDERCSFCEPDRAKTGFICVIASARDAFAIENTHEYQGLYHVLGGLLSPMHGMGAEKLNLDLLKQRIATLHLTDVVLALDSTLEGDATSLYIKRELDPLHLNISRLAFGIPLGSSLDYVDGGTLARAFLGRGRF